MFGVTDFLITAQIASHRSDIFSLCLEAPLEKKYKIRNPKLDTGPWKRHPLPTVVKLVKFKCHDSSLLSASVQGQSSRIYTWVWGKWLVLLRQTEVRAGPD